MSVLPHRFCQEVIHHGLHPRRSANLLVAWQRVNGTVDKFRALLKFFFGTVSIHSRGCSKLWLLWLLALGSCGDRLEDVGSSAVMFEMNTGGIPSLDVPTPSFNQCLLDYPFDLINLAARESGLKLLGQGDGIGINPCPPSKDLGFKHPTSASAAFLQLWRGIDEIRHLTSPCLILFSTPLLGTIPTSPPRLL